MVENKVKFSVIIPTSIDRGLVLPYSVASVQRQTIQDFEILIIGDGANEFTKEVISDLMNEDSRIRFFDFPKHERRGEENRHEVLMNEAKGENIAYICDRDLWLPHHLETLGLYLSRYDFASTLNYAMNEGKETLIYGRKNLDSRRAASWYFSSVGHTIKYYKKLPYGWRTTPQGIPTDLYMWWQFVDQPDCNSYCGLEPTFLWFKRGEHPGISSELRKVELDRWEKIMKDPFLFKMKKEEALHEMMSGFNFWKRNHLILIKGRKLSQVPYEMIKKIKKVLSLQ